jgi:hypothetical protein
MAMRAIVIGNRARVAHAAVSLQLVDAYGRLRIWRCAENVSSSDWVCQECAMDSLGYGVASAASD